MVRQLMPSIHPQSIDDITASVQQAISEQKQITLSQGANNEASTISLHLDRLNQIIDYPFDDMTITVQAGITCGELGSILAEHNQQLPIDVYGADTTIGQLVALNLFGPRICGYGTIRDYLIGIQAVDGAGRVFRAGGKVVKNVAGYDLCRLMIGSHGRLGVITECTFKLNPIPTSTAAIRLQFHSTSELSAAFDALNLSNARPTLIDIHSNHQEDAYAVLVVGVEGSSSSCQWQLEQIQQECKSPAVEIIDPLQVTNYLNDPDHFWSPDQQRIKTRRSEVAPVADQLIQRQHAIHGYAANGILHCTEDGQVRSSLIESIPATRIQFSDWKPAFEAQQHALNKRLLNTFDPHGIFVDASRC